MKLDKIINIITAIFQIVLICVGIIICIAGIKSCFTKHKQITSPVEESIIDSLTNENNILIIKVNDLDSIKDAKIIEVKKLDNDSTLKLFYELISEQ